MVLFQVRRRGLTYTCVIKRSRDSGVLNGYILVHDDHPLSTRNTAAMAVIMAMDVGLSLGQTYAFSIRQPNRSVSPVHYDPNYAYFTVENWKEVIMAKVNELDNATKAEQERIAARQAAEAGGQPVPHEDGIDLELEDEYDEDEEEEDDEDTEEDSDDEAINTGLGSIVAPVSFLTSEEIFSTYVPPTPQTPRR